LLSAKIRICSAISSRVSRCPPCTSRGANKRGRKFQQPLQLATHPFFPEHESSESVTLISKMHLERKNFIETFSSHEQMIPKTFRAPIIEPCPDQPRKPNPPPLDHTTMAPYIYTASQTLSKVRTHCCCCCLLLIIRRSYRVILQLQCADPHQGETVFISTAIGRGIRTARAATWTGGPAALPGGLPRGRHRQLRPND